jgi:anion-transporting  ArsA/GET3 family ATPase
VKGQTERVMALLKSRRTAVHLVTVLEDMPVQETADGIADLQAHGLPVGGVVVNLTRPDVLDADARRRALAGELSTEEVAKGLAEAGCGQDPALVEGLVAEGRAYAERRELEDRQRERIAALDVRRYELPRLPDGIDLGALYELAQDLREQGMA